jgi:hypothetical protein
MFDKISRSTTFVMVASQTEILNYNYTLTYDYRAYEFLWY